MTRATLPNFRRSSGGPALDWRLAPLLIAVMLPGLTPPAAATAIESPKALSGLAIHHVQVLAKDVDALADWYTRILGFQVTKRVAVAGLKIVWLDIPGFRLGLAQIPVSRLPSSAASTPDEASVHGYRQIHFSVANVDEAYNLLVSRGVRFRVVPTSYAITGIRLATFSDPEDNLISLYHDVGPANLPVGNQPPRASGDIR